MTKRLRLFLYFIILIYLFTACTTYQQNERPEEVEDPLEQEEVISDTGPTRGGTINLYVPHLDFINPLFTKSKSTAEVLGLVYNSMFTLDDQMNALPCLVERWEVSPDGMTWTFYLRKDVKWHDHVQFTAKDIDFTFKMLSDNQYDSNYKYNIRHVSYFSVVDQFTFKVVLSKPYGNFLALMTFPIIPQHQLQGIDPLQISTDIIPVGTGPYKIKEYEPYKQIMLTVNPLWWGGEDIPYIDNVYIQVMKDNETALFALEAKELDYVATDAVDWEKYIGKGDIQGKEYDTNKYEFLAVNFNNDVLRDNFVRRAIAHAIDRDKIINEVLLGHGKKTDVPIHPESWLFDSSRQIYNYDIQKAKQILAQGGWKDTDNDGILDKMIDDFKVSLSFELLTNRENEIRVKATRLIVDQLREIGMDVKFRAVVWSELNEIIADKSFDLILTGMNLSLDNDLSTLFHSAEIDTGANYISYNNPLMDQSIEKALTAVDFAQMKYNYSLLQKRIVEELPYISLYFRTSAVLHSQRLRGEVQPLGTNIYNNIHKWYLIN